MLAHEERGMEFQYITSIPYDIKTWVRTLAINNKWKIYQAQTLSKEHRRNCTGSCSLFSVSERPHDMLLFCFYYGNVGFLISSKPVDIIEKSICCTGRPIWSYSGSFHSNSDLFEAKQKKNGGAKTLQLPEETYHKCGL